MSALKRALAATTLFLALAGCGDAATTPESSASAAGDTFPVTVDHAFGKTVLEAKPERVVVVGYSEQDYYLALGTVPVAIRDWYGDQPSATWPWAQSYLKGAKPTVLPRADLDYEQILGLDPDVIVGVSAGLTQEQFDTLNKIAPTVAQPSADDPWAVTWQDKTRKAGQILGRSAEAEKMVTDLETRLAAASTKYPQLKGASTVFASGFEGQFYIFSPNATGSQVLLDLGLTMSDEVGKLTDNANDYYTISKERFDLLDVKVAVWSEAPDDALIKQLLANPLYTDRAVHKEGRDVFLGQEANGAFSFSSVLSLPYVIDTIVPALAAAVDGDVATTSDFSAK
ncbi:iron-siderophore ABC transporter substrate-binding protein [Actinoplanes couchii]|uniref:ABC transporter substrate-binding protein n=1 Tax=Actinoplanes couchii TaxID=403638 RepID=A0ABQ3XSG0_9ACTN|nr:iron-siderophore ABC transporter substrate-binding protein [Actinoplanes couchii]MDR6320080.1 iron complex transport system substrate-binding protein [Actinoplanes couchii]GID61448.1 ABC transporter substrate-binding protein [Actinoplanes couchii]